MHGVRGVASKHKPIGDEGPGDLKVERKGLARAGQGDVTEQWPEAARELGGEARLIKRHDGRPHLFFLRPYDGRPVALERQDGEGAGRKEMLYRAALMRLRMRHRRDDADLRIAPGDALDAGALPKLRAFAVGGDEKRRFDRSAACKLHPHEHRPGPVIFDAVSGLTVRLPSPFDGAGKRGGEIPDSRS